MKYAGLIRIRREMMQCMYYFITNTPHGAFFGFPILAREMRDFSYIDVI